MKQDEDTLGGERNNQEKSPGRKPGNHPEENVTETDSCKRKTKLVLTAFQAICAHGKSFFSFDLPV